MPYSLIRYRRTLDKDTSHHIFYFAVERTSTDQRRCRNRHSLVLVIVCSVGDDPDNKENAFSDADVVNTIHSAIA